jgi:hypothetical protein
VRSNLGGPTSSWGCHKPMGEKMGDFHGRNQKYQIYDVVLDYIGLYWIILDYIGLYWTILDYIGLYWIMKIEWSILMGCS